eukprot:CAMPEP_0198727540 /NCGR_PEP_ID=MMETSP1475-20131203/4427_1 /TAXON_ID= ORGANISM="Unidentified sp., Strain CCMP1999" /NCGR_SAMPLE_ID=MMETSP1475 /ASSEMBLY_ACC=CAM_ASM_001111 /LENGTH=306 /DNA_ID=CAMNT_0044489591 /DNA_START=68 /DNA_END=989 /DNA_ORIENTATION=+
MAAFAATARLSDRTRAAHRRSVQCMCAATPVTYQAGKSKVIARLANVEGEWFGYEVSFSGRTGERQSIPEWYIPEEYLNWNMKVFGFDCVTSVLLEGSHMFIKRTRSMPTVGCEADAVIPEVQERQISLSPANGFVGFSNGSYSLGPVNYTSANQFESVLHANGRRLRVIHSEVNGFQPATVFYDTWDSEFMDGALLPGCGSKQARIEDNGGINTVVDLTGRWARTGVIWMADGDEKQIDDEVDLSEEVKRRSFPEDLTVHRIDTKDGMVRLEIAWRCDEDQRIVLVREHDESGSLRSEQARQSKE